MARTLRAGALASGIVGVLILNGCSLWPGAKATEPTVVLDTPAEAAPADTVVAKKSAPPVQKKTPRPNPPAAAADSTKLAGVARPDSSAGPMISVRMTPEEKAEREAFFAEETLRATRALEAIRNKPLTQLQQDQMASADRFLMEARTASDTSDLHRACTLAEKARIIAEGLEKKLR